MSVLFINFVNNTICDSTQCDFCTVDYLCNNRPITEVNVCLIGLFFTLWFCSSLQHRVGGCGRNPSSLISRCSSSILQEELGETTKAFVKIVAIRSENRTQDVPNTKERKVAHHNIGWNKWASRPMRHQNHNVRIWKVCVLQTGILLNILYIISEAHMPL